MKHRETVLIQMKCHKNLKSGILSGSALFAKINTIFRDKNLSYFGSPINESAYVRLWYLSQRWAIRPGGYTTVFMLNSTEAYHLHKC